MSELNQEITTLSIPLKSAKIPNEVTDRKTGKLVNSDFIPFGSDNLFPQVWELQMRNSVVGRSIIKDKVTYTMGDGLDFQEDSSLANYGLMVNSLGQSYEQVLNLVYRDRYSGGNGYVEFVKKDGFLSIFHKDWTECRYSKTGEYIMLHPEWSNYENSKKLAVNIPVYPNFAKVEGLEGERAIIHLKNYEPEFNWYGLPDGVAAKNAIAIGYSTTGWNKSRIENGMNVSGMLMLSGRYSDPQAKKVKTDIENAFTGEDNQGKVFTIVKESGTDGTTDNTEFIPVGTQSDGDWLNLSNEAKGEILMALNWKRSLTSFGDNTGFDTNRILNEYYVALSTVIIPEQRVVLSKINQIITLHTNFNALGIKHINKPPVPLFMVMSNPDSAFTIGEVRESAGQINDPLNSTHNDYLGKSGSENKNVAEVVSNLTMDNVQKKNILMIVYGYSEAEAEVLIQVEGV